MSLVGHDSTEKSIVSFISKITVSDRHVRNRQNRLADKDRLRSPSICDQKHYVFYHYVFRLSVRLCVRAYVYPSEGILQPACRRILVSSEMVLSAGNNQGFDRLPVCIDVKTLARKILKTLRTLENVNFFNCYRVRKNVHQAYYRST